MHKHILLFGLILILLLQPAHGHYSKVVYYANVTPDHESLQSALSTVMGAGTSWSVSPGELLMNTAHLKSINFGNHPVDPVSWHVAENNEGNLIIIRAKLAEDSGGWAFLIEDDEHMGWLVLNPGHVIYNYTDVWEGTYTVDTNDYHTYAILLYDGKVHYYIDGDVIHQGNAPVTNFNMWSGGKYMLIGDQIGSGGAGYGSCYVDEATFVTSPDGYSIISDIYRDCYIDWIDLELMASQWLNTPTEPSADLNLDGIVAYEDFAILASRWLQFVTDCP